MLIRCEHFSHEVFKCVPYTSLTADTGATNRWGGFDLRHDIVGVTMDIFFGQYVRLIAAVYDAHTSVSFSVIRHTLLMRY